MLLLPFLFTDGDTEAQEGEVQSWTGADLGSDPRGWIQWGEQLDTGLVWSVPGSF